MDEGYLLKRSWNATLFYALSRLKKKERILPTQNKCYFAGIGCILKERVAI